MDRFQSQTDNIASGTDRREAGESPTHPSSGTFADYTETEGAIGHRSRLTFHSNTSLATAC